MQNATVIGPNGVVGNFGKLAGTTDRLLAVAPAVQYRQAVDASPTADEVVGLDDDGSVPAVWALVEEVAGSLRVAVPEAPVTDSEAPPPHPAASKRRAVTMAKPTEVTKTLRCGRARRNIDLLTLKASS